MFDGTDWTTVFVAAITGATALIGALLTLTLHLSEGRRERKSVRAALLAEVAALAHLMRENDYLEELKVDIGNLHLRLSTARPFMSQTVEPLYYQIPVPETYNLIYRTNISRLGALKPVEAEQIVLFYQLLQSIIVDASPGGYLADGTHDLRKVESTIQMLSKALDLAFKLRAKRPWWTLCGLIERVKSAVGAS
ncbi:MAG: hypothetical protein ACN6O6_16400 [Pseudomonas sp.]|uniref:hypothetical protein n=1 Tax=Pseudomonas sp. TaxID=306 RepID=UPI003D1313FD